MWATWSTNVNPLSTTTPRSRTQLDGWMEAPCSCRGSVVHCCTRRDVPSHITLVLAGLSLSRLLAIHVSTEVIVSHVSHQLSRLWWVSMAVYLKVVSVRVHTESSVLNEIDDITGIQYEKNRTQNGPLWNATRRGHHVGRFVFIANKLRAPGQIRRHLIQSTARVLWPYVRRRRQTRIWWSTVSNAALRSRRLSSFTRPASAAMYASDSTFSMAVSVEW